MTNQEQAFLALIAIGTFSIDEQGRVWRLKEYAGGSKMGTPAPERTLKLPRRAETSVSRKHLKIQFRVGGERLWVYSHRIVWMVANQCEIPIGMEINHKDGNPSNNTPSNLEIVTHQENALHAARVLGVMGKKEQRGEKNTSAKLTPEDVLVIRMLWDKREVSQSEMAKRYGVSQVTINEVCLRKTWKHLP